MPYAKPALAPRRPAWRPFRWLWARRGLAVGGGLLLLLLPYLALAFYAQPYWDDYDYANLLRWAGGFWAVSKYLYFNHTGRFFTLALAALNPLAHGWPTGLGVSTLAVLAATAAAQAWALRVLARQRLGWGAALAWAAALLLGELWGLPSPHSAFYWFSSAMVYQVPVVLQLLWPVATLQALRASHRWGRAGWYGLAGLAVLAAVGTNELSGLLLGWALAWLSYLAYRRADWPALRSWLGLGALALVAGAVALAAPGNFARLHHVGSGQPAALWSAGRQAALYTWWLLTEPRLLLALAVAPVLLAGLGYRYRHLRPAGLRLPLAAGVVFAVGGVALQMLFLSSIAWGYPAVRTLNFTWLGLFFSWLLVLWAALPSAGPSPTARLLMRLRLPALLCALLAGRGAERAAWREWRQAPAWQRQLAARDAAIRQARQAGARRVAVAPLTNIEPQYVLIIGELLSHQAAASYNQDAARWYGLDSLRLSRPGLPPADVRLH